MHPGETNHSTLPFIVSIPLWWKALFELPHDKTNKITVRPAKSQISLGICPVWSESSLCTQWVAKDPSFLQADSEDWSDWADAQADLSLWWVHMSFYWFCHEAAHFSFTYNHSLSLHKASIDKLDILTVRSVPFISLTGAKKHALRHQKYSHCRFQHLIIHEIHGQSTQS